MAMTEIYFKATFIGAPLSLGYEVGKEYELHVKLRWNEPYFIIQRINGGGRCPYNNFFTMLQNWSNISMIK